MKLKKNARKLSAVLMSAVVFATSFAYSAPTVSAEETTRSVEDIAADQAALEQEQADIQAQIDALDAETADANEKAELLESQLLSISKQIATANSDIEELDTSIKELNEKLSAAEDEYADTLALFKERIKAIYKTGSVGTLEILLNADSYSDYMMRLQTMQSVSKHDNELMEKMNEFMEATKDTRSELKAKKKEVAELKVTLEDKTEEINTLYSENQEVLTELANKRAEANSSLDEANAYADQLYAEMIAAMATPEPTVAPTAEPSSSSSTVDKNTNDSSSSAENVDKSSDTSDDSSDTSDDSEPVIDADDNSDSSDDSTTTDDSNTTDDSTNTDDSYDDNSNNNSDDSYDDNSNNNSGGGISLICPCPGYVYISAGYGGYDGHYGTDFAASYGTAIVAAADGTVSAVNDTDTWGYSWGYYVLIYHNDEFSTRYAHMSSIVVSPGEYVTAGQVIGYVGLTGNTTGPHLHFELYQWGSRVDAEAYL